jgi:murein DD-endopeptidase MepM/ murein hydrolase activator NlpD
MRMKWKRGFIYLGCVKGNKRKIIYLAVMIALVTGSFWVFLGGDLGSADVLPVHDAEKAKEYARLIERQEPSNRAVNKVSLTVAEGDTFSGVLQKYGISERQAKDIRKAVKEVFDLSKVSAGHELTLVFSQNAQTLRGIEYEIGDYSKLQVSIQGEKIEAQTQQIDRILKPKILEQQESINNNEVRQVDLKVKRGDNIFSLLKACGICTTQIHSLFHSIKREYNLADIVPGHPLKVWLTRESPAKLTKLTYDITPVSYIEVTPKDGLFKAQTLTRPMEVVCERAEGTVKSSLYDSAVQSGLSPEIVMDLSDIFGWDINFFTDIQKGDTYTVLYEKYYVENKFKGYGRVVAARFVTQGEEHMAIYFDDGKGNHGYYDEHGQPIRKLFLKAPLNYRRISSGFTTSRMHPIFHVQRPHLGVDYAAPTGTPVVALGEGRIISIGWASGFGQSIQIKHPGGYVTYYGHLSRFAKGMVKGKSVSQGDVIGYVGMTGFTTGPHLDFRVRHCGTFTNPLKLAPVNGSPLHGKALAGFKQASLKRLTMLDDTNFDKSQKLSKSG